MSSDPWALGGCVERLLAFRKARDWEQYHRPKELAAALAIEGGELQELFLWKADESAEQVRGDSARLERVREELADVTIFALLLAHDLQINLDEAVEQKITSNEERYPAAAHRGVAKKSSH